MRCRWRYRTRLPNGRWLSDDVRISRLAASVRDATTGDVVPAGNRVLALVIGGGYRAVRPPRRFGGWVQAPVSAGALRFLPAARLVDRAVVVVDHRRQLGPSKGALPDLLEERAPEPPGPIPLRVRVDDSNFDASVALSDAHRFRQVGVVADDDRRVALAQERIPQQARRQIDVRALLLGAGTTSGT